MRRTREREREEKEGEGEREEHLLQRRVDMYIYVSICTHEVTPYMIKGSSKDDHAMYDKEIIGR
jgi:hypothetical protein